MKKISLFIALCASFFVSMPSFAESGPSYLSLGAGFYDIFDDSAGDFRVEYRHGDALFWKIKPWAGAEATSDASVWGGVGLLADFNLAPNIYLTPSVGVGLYAHGSSDTNLDYPIEFRSQLEAGYEFTNGHRLGVSFGHMSNASLGDRNPGAETLGIYYHLPIAGF